MFGGHEKSARWRWPELFRGLGAGRRTGVNDGREHGSECKTGATDGNGAGNFAGSGPLRSGAAVESTTAARLLLTNLDARGPTPPSGHHRASFFGVMAAVGNGRKGSAREGIATLRRFRTCLGIGKTYRLLAFH